METKLKTTKKDSPNCTAELKRNNNNNNKREAFGAVLLKQCQYHNEVKSSKQIKYIAAKINEKIANFNNSFNNLKNQAIIFIVLIVLSFTLQSCDKNYNEPIPPETEQRELITQNILLENIYSMPQTKGFDPTLWVYEYSTNPAVITFTNTLNPLETVTKTCTIQELQAGISVQIFVGNYNITYKTSSASNKLDIKINMSNISVNGTPIPLIATYADYLLIVDMPNILSVTNTQNADIIFNLFNGFYYAYLNIIAITSAEITVKVDGIGYKIFSITGDQCGNVYWYTNKIAANTTITFPVWLVNKIVL